MIVLVPKIVLSSELDISGSESLLKMSELLAEIVGRKDCAKYPASVHSNLIMLNFHSVSAIEYGRWTTKRERTWQLLALGWLVL